MKLWIIFVISIVLTSCASPSLIQMRVLERDGSLRVVEADRLDHEYKFYIRVGVDIGLNTAHREDREHLIRQYLEGRCKNFNIIEEQFIQSPGSIGSSKNIGTFMSRVSCIR
jgi:hypothetical protein